MPGKSLCLSDYTVGWICALEEESLAAMGMFDQRHEDPYPYPTDDNAYTYGEIYTHNVVIAQLPAGHTGKAGAASTATQFSQSFPSIKIYLFVGIGGGMPSNPYQENLPIYLGDVVVSAPRYSGVPAVAEHDRGRKTTEGHVSFSIQDQPMKQLVAAVDKVARNYLDGGMAFHRHLERLGPENLRKRKVNYPSNTFEQPDSQYDVLFSADSIHKSGEDHTCSQCERTKIIRQSPGKRTPNFHRGPIASGDCVIQDGEERDKLSKAFKNAICFETEAAGIMRETHCLVIRGISDYADSHKSYIWHSYASATAAAFARQLLRDMPSKNLKDVESKRLSAQLPSAQGSSTFRNASPIAEMTDSSDPAYAQGEASASSALVWRGNPATRSDNIAAYPASTSSDRVRGQVRALEGASQPPPTRPDDRYQQPLPRTYPRDDKY
jgi:nucleoside phosphorylase